MAASEFDLIAAINERLPAPGPRVRVPSGDDAAVVEPRAASAVTVDAIVDGVHFRLEDFGAAAVGRKALAAGLSDLAAMGAAQGEAYVVVGAPRDLPDDQLLGIADGPRRGGRARGGFDRGRRSGRLSRARRLGDRDWLRARRVTLRHPRGRQAARRRRGDRGAGRRCGRSRPAGGAGSGAARPGERPRAAPGPPARPGSRLQEGRPWPQRGRRAMIDVSDGLGADASHLADSSECRLEIDLDRVPIAEGVAERRRRPKGGTRAGRLGRRGLRAARHPAAGSPRGSRERGRGGGLEADRDRLRRPRARASPCGSPAAARSSRAASTRGAGPSPARAEPAPGALGLAGSAGSPLAARSGRRLGLVLIALAACGPRSPPGARACISGVSPARAAPARGPRPRRSRRPAPATRQASSASVTPIWPSASIRTQVVPDAESGVEAPGEIRRPGRPAAPARAAPARRRPAGRGRPGRGQQPGLQADRDQQRRDTGSPAQIPSVATTRQRAAPPGRRVGDGRRRRRAQRTQEEGDAQ